MNPLVTYTQLMFLTLLVLFGLTGCSRSVDDDPILFETRYVSSTENMSVDEWEMLKEKMIAQISQKYSKTQSGKIIIKPLNEGSTQNTPQQKNIRKNSDSVISIPSTLSPNTLVQKKANPALKSRAKVTQYSELKIKPSVAQGKQYKIPPNTVKSASKQNTNYTWPTRGTITLKFGESSNGKKSKGIKIKTKPDTPVLAIHNGKVIFVGSIKGMGKVILVEHPDSIIAAYAQVANISVTPNTSIRKSQKIATVLSRSQNEGEFHFEVRKGVKSIDPTSILP